MDSAVAWFQEEQDGPAKRIWMAIWDTISEMDHSNQTAVNHININNNNNNNNSLEHQPPPHQTTTATIGKSNKDMILIETNERIYYNPSKRKGSTIDNKASTFNMNKYHGRLVGKHGGCPWRPPNIHYGRGVLG